MPAHSLELLHPTDPPGPRALRLVLLLVTLFFAAVAAVSVRDPVGSPSPAEAVSRGSSDRNP
jgi:hypothetical protein